MLCKACVRVLVDAPQDLSSAFHLPSKIVADCYHHASFSEFKAAAASQCVICARIWSYRYTLQQSLDPDFDHDAIDEDDSDKSIELLSLQAETFDLKLKSLPAPKSTEAQIHFEDETNVDWANIFYSRINGAYLIVDLYWGNADAAEERCKVTSDSTGSAEAIEFVRSQLKICDRDHRCFTKKPRSFLPTRLLDLSDAANEEGTVKLITSADTHTHGPYAALSYCWGKANTVTFNKTTSATFRRGIKRSILPQTFQDAISICLELNINYLWIDSLCIFQDPKDLTDWMRESSLMSGVYLHAYVTIVASVSVDCRGGLFRARNPEVMRTKHVYQSDSMELSGKKPSLMISASDDDETYFVEVLQTALGKRGWALQERILSKRKIFFGARQVLWECDELQSCETDPSGAPDAFQSFNRMILSSFDSLHKQLTGVAFPNEQWFWEHVVQQYSKCSLTHPTDKLVAISGVARAMASVTGDSYIAGMWKSTLHLSILKWHTIGFGKRTKEYLAPTFSWASSDSAIDHHASTMGKVWISLVDFSIEASPDEYGAVTAGYIRVQSFLKPLKVTMRDTLPSAEQPWSLRPGDLQPIDIDCVENIKSSRIIGRIRVHFDIDPRTLSAGDENGKKSITIYYTGPRTAKDLEWMQAPYLLLLHKDQGTFEKVGIMEWFLQYPDEITLKEEDESKSELWSMNSLFADEDKIPCESYDAERCLHTYCIV